MKMFTPNWRWLAIPVSLTFVYGGLRVLLGPSLMTPDTWEDYQILTILIVAVTIGVGHLTGVAFRNARYLSSIGFCILFAAGTVLVVRQSLNRQAEAAGQTVLATEDLNEQISDLRTELKDAKARKKNAERQADKEMTGEHCGTNCKAWKQNAKDIGVVVDSLEDRISKLGPQRPVNAGAEHLADMAGFFGYQREKTITLDTLFTPLLTTLLFELGSIISLSFAFRPSDSVSNAKSLEAELAELRKLVPMFSDPTPEPVPTFSGNVVSIADHHPVVRALKANGGEVPSNNFLAACEEMNCSPGEASKRVDEVEALGLVEREQHGKEVRIRLKRTA